MRETPTHMQRAAWNRLARTRERLDARQHALFAPRQLRKALDLIGVAREQQERELAHLLGLLHAKKNISKPLVRILFHSTSRLVLRTS